MNQGVLYRYAPDSESDEAQLVVPSHERERVLKEYHDDPTAGHYGAEGTYQRVSQRYYFTGMRKFIAEYVKSCNECNMYKPSNQKPSGLLQTPIYGQRFETLSIDLFGPLPETADGKKWIFIVEDYNTRWIELFALPNATAKECAITLIEEVFLRYGIPRRIISDNGTQFVSAVMQQVCFLLKISQELTPVYHPQANPVERKNRDLKPQLAILVGDDHTTWAEKLPIIRFSMNTHKCETTGQTAAFLQFGRELRTVDEVTHDLRSIVENDNFVAEITPYLKRFSKIESSVRELVEHKQDDRKKYADKKRRPGLKLKPGDHVWVDRHPQSKTSRGRTSKFMPRRDGPYVIVTQKSPTTYVVANPDTPQTPAGVYHSSALRPHLNPTSSPTEPLRKRGRPKGAGFSPRTAPRRNQRGSVTDVATIATPVAMEMLRPRKPKR